MWYSCQLTVKRVKICRCHAFFQLPKLSLISLFYIHYFHWGGDRNPAEEQSLFPCLSGWQNDAGSHICAHKGMPNASPLPPHFKLAWQHSGDDRMPVHCKAAVGRRLRLTKGLGSQSAWQQKKDCWWGNIPSRARRIHLSFWTNKGGYKLSSSGC